MRKKSRDFRKSYANILIFGLCGIATLANADYYSQSNKGWFWYEQHPRESFVLLESKSVLPQPSQPIKITQENVTISQSKESLSDGARALKELNEWKQQLEEDKALAIMYPTPDNVWKYQQQKEKILNQASTYTKMSLQNNWQRPNAPQLLHGSALDQSAIERNSCAKDFLKQEANRYGFFLFVGSDCKNCNMQVLVQKHVQRKYGVSTMIIGFDGFKPNNPDNIPYGKDNGISQNFGVKNVGKPVTVLFDSKSKKATIISYGYATIDELDKRVCRLLTSKDN